MKKLFWKYWPPLTLSLLILLSLVVPSPTQTLSKEEVIAKVTSVMQKCKKKGTSFNSLDVKCAQVAFQKYVSRETLGSVMDVLQEMFSKQENAQALGIPSCHLPAHIVGSIAFQKGVTFSELMRTCPTQCGFGCLHGGFQEMFRESGKDFLEDFPGACLALPAPSDEDLRSCWHITGHGLGEVYQEDLDTAVSQCMRLPTDRSKWHCVSGVRMEYLVGSPDNPARLEITVDNLIAYCKRFPVEYQEDCFGEAGFYIYRTLTDEDATVEVCNKIPLPGVAKLKCATAGGTGYFLAHKDSPEAVYSFCNKYGGVLAQECLIGALEVAASEWDFYKNGVTICRMANPGFKKECLAYFGKSLEKWNGLEFRQNACGELVEPERSYCLSMPSNPREYLLPPK